MARSTETDPLATYAFWLMDVGPTDLANLPIFTPLFGFASISAPEIQAETTDIVEGNWLFTRKVLKRASCSNITLSRGVFFYDSDFWRWFMTALVGSTASGNVLPGLGFASVPHGLQIGGPTYRRNFLLIQYFAKALFPGPTLAGAVAGAAAATALAAATTAATGGTVPLLGMITTAALLTTAAMNVGPFEFAARIPAKAWMLLDCIPVRWRSGTDFDANSNAVSIQEVEFAIERIEEISLAG